ncbi:MAG: hypothetical protein H6Q90_1574 [Deltaproteobacteria bacterium]|nr:hypothetical protein [Deltaproteobacteria bacterium]
MIISHRGFAIATLCAGLATTRVARADEVSKEVCVDAHSRGQDAKDQGKLSLARKLFMTCAQTSCPALVQGDCARFADDLTRLQPSLSFAARDSSGADLPDTSVYVDDVLVVTRLDDGKPHDVDPGKHVVKFSHDGKEKVLTIVVGTGDKGRAVTAKFASARLSDAGGTQGEPSHRAPRPTHPLGAKVLIGTGTVLAVGGLGLGVLGITRLPSNCSISTHQCAAPPGDPSFDQAGRALQLTNMGLLATGVGVAAVVGGLIWYGKHGKATGEEKLVAPWFTPSSAGLAFSGSL